MAQSILRYTSTDSNNSGYGDRWLAFWFKQNSYKLQFVAGTTKKKNQSFDTNGIKGNRDNEIKVEVIGDKISLYINGEFKGSLSNENRPYTPELKVYAGDKFHAPAYAKISDLTITPIETPNGACLPKSGFEILANGCSYDKVVASLQHKLSNEIRGQVKLSHAITRLLKSLNIAYH